MGAHLADGVVMGERLQWYDERADNAPRTDALARNSPHAAIDQYSPI